MRLRVTIAGLLLGVTMNALFLATVESPSGPWGSMLFTAVLVLLLAGLLGVLYRTSDSRAFWVGFTLFGWCYFGLAYGPKQITDRVERRLAAVALADHLLPYVRQELSKFNSKLYIDWPSESCFIGVLHCYFNLFFALMGGLLGRHFYVTRMEQTNAK